MIISSQREWTDFSKYYKSKMKVLQITEKDIDLQKGRMLFE